MEELLQPESDEIERAIAACFLLVDDFTLRKQSDALGDVGPTSAPEVFAKTLASLRVCEVGHQFAAMLETILQSVTGLCLLDDALAAVESALVDADPSFLSACSTVAPLVREISSPIFYGPFMNRFRKDAATSGGVFQPQWLRPVDLLGGSSDGVKHH